jgi:hypothetical protein
VGRIDRPGNEWSFLPLYAPLMIRNEVSNHIYNVYKIMLNFLSLYHFFVNLDFARMPETREQQGRGAAFSFCFCING